MAALRVTQHELSLLEELRYAVHGLGAPFACGGTLVPDQPLTLCFQDQTQIPVLRAPRGFEQEQLLYGALHVEIPPYGTGTRVVGQGEPPREPVPAPRKRSARKK